MEAFAVNFSLVGDGTARHHEGNRFILLVQPLTDSSFGCGSSFIPADAYHAESSRSRILGHASGLAQAQLSSAQAFFVVRYGGAQRFCCFCDG